MKKIAVVIGDIHAELALASIALQRIEKELGEIDQVFCVGDLSLFFTPQDWEWLTGPKHHRHPEKSQEIKDAWDNWKWPLALIGGNHENYLPLRRNSLSHPVVPISYKNAGRLEAQLEGFECYGLSGIYHEKHLEFLSLGDPKNITSSNWIEFSKLVEEKLVGPKRLTYFKSCDLEELKMLPPSPHLLLTHDWPLLAPNIKQVYQRRPENEINELLQPVFHCCGHHHQQGKFTINNSSIRALNILSNDGSSINPGWAWIFEWSEIERKISEVGFWPRAL